MGGTMRFFQVFWVLLFITPVFAASQYETDQQLTRAVARGDINEIQMAINNGAATDGALKRQMSGYQSNSKIIFLLASNVKYEKTLSDLYVYYIRLYCPQISNIKDQHKFFLENTKRYPRFDDEHAMRNLAEKMAFLDDDVEMATCITSQVLKYGAGREFLVYMNEFADKYDSKNLGDFVSKIQDEMDKMEKK
jgi:hypothetical protein